MGNVSANDLVFLQGIFILVCCPMNIVCDNLWNLKTDLIEGGYIRYYFKPGNSLFFYLSETINVKALPELFVGIYLVYSGLENYHFNWVSLSSFILVLLVSTLTPISIRTISAATGFWIVNSHGTILFSNNIMGYGKYPFSIFVKQLSLGSALLIPILFIAYIPFKVLTSKYTIVLLILCSFFNILLLKASLLIWKKGDERSSSTGS